LLIVAALQALIGLSQYVAGDRPTGTYANPDHLAGLLEMTLPVALALLVAHVGHQIRPDHPSRSWRKRMLAWVSLYTSSVALYGLLAMVILLGLIFTKSRSGVLLAMLVIVLCAVAFARRLGGNNAFGAVGSFITIAVGFAVTAGLVPVLERFARVDHLQDARWPIFAAMADAIPAYLPLGSGIGTFREIFERFQPFDLYGTTVNHAHNDYFEWLMEGGLPAAAILSGLLLTFLWRWPQLITRGQWRTIHMVQVGAGIGIIAMLFHSLVDFNLRIPANQIVFAFLAALFFARHDETASVQRKPAADSQPEPVPAAKSEPTLAATSVATLAATTKPQEPARETTRETTPEPTTKASRRLAPVDAERIEPSLETKLTAEAKPVRRSNPSDE
jgi:O-antigen ligase